MSDMCDFRVKRQNFYVREILEAELKFMFETCMISESQAKFKRDNISEKISIKKDLHSKQSCAHITLQVFFMQLVTRRKPR